MCIMHMHYVLSQYSGGKMQRNVFQRRWYMNNNRRHKEPEISMRYTDEDKLRVKERMPELIMKYDLFTDRERYSFSPEHGGVFRCPVCGHRIAIYRKKGSASNPWGLNGFGHCTCFGDNGHAKDIFGLYAAIRGISDDEAFRELMDNELGISDDAKTRSDEFLKTRNEEAERKRLASEESMLSAYSTALFGTAMPRKGREYLRKRGIILSELPESIVSSIGYLPPTDILSKNGKTYKAEGIVFRLWNNSYQLRRTRYGEYVSKGGPRFSTAGPAYPFNVESIGASSPLLLTEGPFDAISAAELGMTSTVALVGAGNRSYIGELIRTSGYRGIVFIGFDYDTAGRKGARALSNALKTIEGITVLPAPLSGGYGDMNAFLIADKERARKRIRILRGIAENLSSGAMAEESAREMLSRLMDADAKGPDPAAACDDNLLKALERIWKDSRLVRRKN